MHGHSPTGIMVLRTRYHGTYPWRFACDASSLVSIGFAVSLLWVCMTKHSRDDAVNLLSLHA